MASGLQTRPRAVGAALRQLRLPAFGVPRRPRTTAVVAAAAAVPTAPDLGADSYCCLGLAHCFRKNEQGRMEDVYIIEPLSASSLECMAAGARTSFKLATGARLADAAARDKAALPPAFGAALWCDKWDERLGAAARTWLRPHAQDNLMDIVPLGKVRDNFNFSLDDKRVLNMDNVVNDDDNIKQDISIDVYGRADKADKEQSGAAAKAASASAAQQEQEAAAAAAEAEEDELDALLAG